MSLRRRLVLSAWLATAGLAWATPVRGQVVVPPRLVSAQAPDAPPGHPLASDLDVPVLVTVDVQGRVVAAVVEVAGDPDLDAAALTAARAHRFEPATRDGAAVASRVRLLVHFEATHAPPTTPTVHPPEERDPHAGPSGTTPPHAPVQEPQAEEVEVVGVRRPAPVAASDFTVDVSTYRDVPRRNAEELLTLAPGLFLASHSGEGHASSIFLRGFDAGEGQDLEIRVDGVPVNEPSNAHGHGYVDTHFLVPEVVDRLRILEGPFDPRQGDFAVAGSTHYELGLAKRGIVTKAVYGSYAHKRGVLLWGPHGEERGTFVALDAVDGDGFGPNRAYGSARAMARYEKRVGKGMRLALLGTSYAGRFDAAGVVREDDVLARRMPCASDRDSQLFCTYDGNQGGASDRHGISASLRKDEKLASWELAAWVVRRGLRARQNYTGYLLDVVPTGEAQRGDGAEQAYGLTSLGTLGRYAVRFDAFGRRHELEVGYEGRLYDARSTMRRLRTADGVPYANVFDDDVRVTNVAAYAATTLRPLERVALRGGLRLDTFGFAVEDHARPTVDRAGARLPSDNLEAFGLALQPKVSVDVRLLRDLRWVSAFGLGSRSSDAMALSQGERAPFARVRATETGLVHLASLAHVRSTTRLVGFHTHVSNDLVFDETRGRNAYVGASNRFGGLLANELHVGWGVDVLSSFTYADAYLPEDGGGAFAFAEGRRLPYVPRWVGRLDANVRRFVRLAGEPFVLGGSLGTSYVAPRPLPFDQLSPAYATVDAAVRAKARGVELALSVQNLLDRRNRLAVFNYASNFRGADAFPSLLPATHAVVGPPRTFFLTATVELDRVGRPLAEDDPT